VPLHGRKDLGPTAMPEWWWNALGLAVGLGLALLLSGAITVRAILLFVLTTD